MDDKPLLESMPDVNNVPATDTMPESAQNDTNQVSAGLETTESSLQVAETFVDSAHHQSEPFATNAAYSVYNLAWVLTDQLQQHHGCCRQCAKQQEREHEI